MKEKSRFIAFLLCLFGAFLGLHNWYLGDYKRATLFTFTVGGFGIWWISDLIKIVTDPDFLENYYDGYKTYKENKQEERLEKLNEIRERNYVPEGHQVRCPKCGSTQLSANKKGFSLGKAVVGGIVLNPILGAATGMIGKDKIIVTCLNCGRQFKAGHGR